MIVQNATELSAVHVLLFVHAAQHCHHIEAAATTSALGILSDSHVLQCDVYYASGAAC